MPNNFFQFKQFTVYQNQCSMKVTTDGCLFGAWVASNICRHANITNILDIGCGTGLLSLMVAQQKFAASIDGIELQHKDYLQAIQNIDASPWKNNIHIIEGDARCFDFKKKYDAIISNPPFYEAQWKSNSSPKNIAHHNEGLLLTELLQIFKTQLHSHGIFYLLYPSTRIKNLYQELKSHNLYINELLTLHQTIIHNSFRIIIKGSLEKHPIQEKKIIIKNGNNYTKDFIALLKPFYLNL